MLAHPEVYLVISTQNLTRILSLLYTNLKLDPEGPFYHTVRLAPKSELRSALAHSHDAETKEATYDPE